MQFDRSKPEDFTRLNFFFRKTFHSLSTVGSKVHITRKFSSKCSAFFCCCSPQRFFSCTARLLYFPFRYFYVSIEEVNESNRKFQISAGRVPFRSLAPAASWEIQKTSERIRQTFHWWTFGEEEKNHPFSTQKNFHLQNRRSGWDFRKLHLKSCLRELF